MKYNMLLKFITSTILSLSIWLLLPSHTFAATHALIIGINEYQSLKPLNGAVNDANLIHRTLLGLGVNNKNIQLLINDDATKDAIQSAWLQMVDRANANDTLIFTYSGHGGQEQDQNGDEADDNYDENFLLSGFQKGPAKAQLEQRIVDDEINNWLQQINTKQLKVIFIADSCHSGSMTRGIPINSENYTFNPNDVPLPEIATEPLPPIPENVLFFNSSTESGKTPEVIIDGVPHGLLSWVFAQALQYAHADQDKDENLTATELRQYITEVVKNKSNNIQFIGSEFRGDNDLVLLPISGKVNPTPTDANGSILFFSENKNLINKLQHIKPTTADKAKLIWNVSKGIVKNNTQDVIAIGISSPEKMQFIINKQRILDYLTTKMMQGHIAQSYLLPDSNSHALNSHIIFKIDQLKYPYLTQFNLAGNGEIQFLYPSKKDHLNIPTNAPYQLALTVTPPFGGDNLVSIISDKPLIELHQLLTDTNISFQHELLLSALSNALTDTQYQISTILHVTTEK